MSLATGLLLFAAAASQQEVSFASADGGVVFALEYGSGTRAVVLAHGGRFTKETWARQAPVLADSGYRVLAIDFRGRGSSRGPADDPTGDAVAWDVLGAVRYLRSTGAASVSIVGASFGGGAAAEAAAAAEPGEIDALVMLAHSPIDDPEAIQGRKLFITAAGDTAGSGRLRLSDIYHQYLRAAPPKELVVLPGSAHAQFLFDTDQGPRLLREILRFLSDSGGSVTPSGHPPMELLGDFTDDYGIEYSISSTTWVQHPATRYQVYQWHPESRFLLARNDNGNPSDGGKWTRIDWLEFEDMDPFGWGYCLTVYQAETREAALAAPSADRAVPRTGCRGFPFSRMKPSWTTP